MAFDAYVRVSDVNGRSGASFISPDLQREQIEGWASANGVEIEETFIELDQSGGRPDRPLLMQALERIETGQSSGLVVAKLDRFGRSLIPGLAALGRIERAGAAFVSVAEGFDLRTPTGRLLMKTLFAWGEWELDRTRVNFDLACGKAIARGVYIAAKGPPGYLRGGDGRLRPDPVTAPLLTEAFRRRANGAGAREIADFLNGSAFRTPSGKVLPSTSVYRIVRNRAYLGEARHGKHTKPGAHEALVDARTFRRAQFRRVHRLDPSTALLAQTARCASCGRSLRSYPPQTKRSPSDTYRCYEKQRLGPGSCPGPAAASAEELEPLVESFVISAAPELDQRWSTLWVGQRKLEIARIIEAVMIQRGREPVAERAWLCLQRSGLDQRPSNAPIERFEPTVGSAVRIPAPATWPVHRIEDGLARVLADRGTWPTYAEFAAAGYARLHMHLMAYGGPYWWGPRMGITIPGRFVIWNEARVRGALRPFLRGREGFPTEGEFRRAGLASLRRAIDKHGGVGHWAEEFGLESGSRGGYWDKEKVARELSDFLGERNFFPTREEFRQAGRIALFQAAKRKGGLPYWQRRFEAPPALWSKHHRPPSNDLAERTPV